MPLVRQSTHADCVELAANMRAEDVAEVWASGRSTPLESLEEGLTVSTRCWSILSDSGAVVGMFGVAPIEEGRVGSPWLLCADGLVAVQRQFIRQSPAYIDLMHQDFPVLWNAADTRNIVHLKWLRRCGFEFLHTFWHNETSFVQFMKIKD